MLKEMLAALAQLVALEARFHDLVNPDQQITEAVRNLSKANAAAIEKLTERVTALESAGSPATPEPLAITITQADGGDAA